MGTGGAYADGPTYSVSKRRISIQKQCDFDRRRSFGRIEVHNRAAIIVADDAHSLWMAN